MKIRPFEQFFRLPICHLSGMVMEPPFAFVVDARQKHRDITVTPDGKGHITLKTHEAAYPYTDFTNQTGGFDTGHSLIVYPHGMNSLINGETSIELTEIGASHTIEAAADAQGRVRRGSITYTYLGPDPKPQS